MELNDFRWSALARYHDQALEAACILTAFARMKISSHGDYIDALDPRTTILIMENMHRFCFYARKSVEIADGRDSSILERCKHLRFNDAGEFEVDIEETIPLTKKDFWWVINRIVHSQEVIVKEKEKITETTQNRIYSVRRACVFGFKSDRDEGDEMHYCLIEELISCYTEIVSSLIEKVIPHPDESIRFQRKTSSAP